MRRKSEKEVQGGVRSIVKLAGGRCVRQVAGAITRAGRVVGKTEKGTADLLCCVPYTLEELEEMGVEEVGVFVAIETKPEGWKIPGIGTKARKHYENQEMFLKQIRKCGGFGIFATSIDDVLDKLNLRKKFWLM